MTKKGFFRSALAAAGIGFLAVSGPVAAVVFAGAVVAGHVGGKIISATATRLAQTFSFIKSNKNHPSGKGEALTKGEAEFAESILGKKLRPELVKKYLSSTGSDNNAKTFGPNKVKFFGQDHYEADYSKPQNLDNAGIFIREMTNVFRAQTTGILTRAFRNAFLTKKSEYELTAKSRFGKFGNEQQASIIEDYARQFIYRQNEGADLRARDEYLTAQGTVQKLSSLKKVVEKEFRQARRTRLQVQTQNTNEQYPVQPAAVRFPVVIH